jgi:hypothetical protein
MVVFFCISAVLSVQMAIRGGMSSATKTRKMSRAQKSEWPRQALANGIAGSAQAGGTLKDFLLASSREIFRAGAQKSLSPFRTVAEALAFKAHSVADSQEWNDGLYNALTSAAHVQSQRRVQEQRTTNYSHWQQILPEVPVVVYGNRSNASEVINLKAPGSALIGKQEGEWLRLSLEPGYVVITSGKETLLWQRSSVYMKLSGGSCADAGVFPIYEMEVCLAAAITLGLPDSSVRNILMHGKPSERLSATSPEPKAESSSCQLVDGEFLSLGAASREDQGDDQHRYEAICSSEPAIRNAVPYTTTSTSTRTTTTSSTVTKTASPSLFCFSVFRPSTQEEDIVRAQIKHNAGVVACDDCGFLSASNVSLPKRRDGREVDLWVMEKGYSAYSPGLGGGVTTNSWLNSEVFLYAWGAVLGNTSIGDKALQYDWVVKADPDAVLIPHRLRWHLQNHNAKQAWYLRNCHGQLYGAVETFSQGAMERYHDSWVQKCATEPWHGWGEDMYMRVCMDRLGVWGFNDDMIVGDERCNPAACWDHSRAAFHAYKNVGAWMNCWYQAGSADH